MTFSSINKEITYRKPSNKWKLTVFLENDYYGKYFHLPWSFEFFFFFWSEWSFEWNKRMFWYNYNFGWDKWWIQISFLKTSKILTRKTSCRPRAFLNFVNLIKGPSQLYYSAGWVPRKKNNKYIWNLWYWGINLPFFLSKENSHLSKVFRLNSFAFFQSALEKLN